MLKKRWQRWLEKRFKVVDQKTFLQKDVLIFLYQQGYLYVVLIIITFIAGVNYANNLILGFCFLISAILCISFYLTFKQLYALQIEIIPPLVGQVDEDLRLKIALKQHQPQMRYLCFSVDQQLHYILMTESQQQIELTFIPQQRGKFDYPMIRIWSVYPLGLVRAWSYVYLTHQSWVAPKALTFSHEYKQPHQSQEQDFDEFRELRDFKQGDSWHVVSWKQVARGQGLYVKNFEQHTDDYRMCIDYQKIPASNHEEKLSLMMGLIEQCEQNQRPYAIILPHAELEFGLGEQQLQHAKCLLAQA